MYGAGDFPQAFARMSAVFGGTYLLDWPMSRVSLAQANDNLHKVESSKGVTIKGQNILLGDIPSTVDSERVAVDQWVGVGPVSIAADVESVLLVVPPAVGVTEHPVHCVQLGSKTEMCPQGLYVLSLTVRRGTTATNWPAILEAISRASQPLAWMWTTSFSRTLSFDPPGSIRRGGRDSPRAMKCGLQPGLAVDAAVERARVVFTQLFPGCEFFPPRNMEDMIVSSEDNDWESAGVSSSPRAVSSVDYLGSAAIAMW